MGVTCSSLSLGSTMLPPGDRHIAAFGVDWHYGPVSVTLGYALVFMCSESVDFTNPYSGRLQKFGTENGLSQSVGLSITYMF